MSLVKIHSHTAIGSEIYELTFVSPVDLQAVGYEPGQFLHIRVTDSFDFLLRRPLSLCKTDIEHNLVTVVYQVKGAGTKRLSEKQVGDVLDVLGPLGHGYPLHALDRAALLIGGGVGVPPLVELARQLQKAGKIVHTVVGFQSNQHAILISELAAYGAVTVVTNDGSLGRKGLVTDELTNDFCSSYDRYYACGPTPMLHSVQQILEKHKLPGYLSLEERMGCGIGICVGCVHKVSRDGQEMNVKTCKEGPVFAAQEVLFT